jgi:hypothetical protein
MMRMTGMFFGRLRKKGKAIENVQDTSQVPPAIVPESENCDATS